MAVVVVECLRCGHRGKLTAAELESHGLGDDTSLVLITRRLVCQDCGSRSIKAFRRDDGDAAGDPTLVPSD